MYRVAISGKANSGKNTLAKLLSNQLDQFETNNRMQRIISNWKNSWDQEYMQEDLLAKEWYCKIMAFADPIKEMVMILFPQTKRESLWGASHLREEVISNCYKDNKPLTYRQVLFDLGTQIGRGYNDNCWLNNFDNRYQQIVAQTSPSLIVVSDCRFRNEFNHLKQKGFYLIRLYRETNQPTINHISETKQSEIKDEEFDYVLHNNQSLEDLTQEVKEKIIPQLKSI